MSFQEIEVPIDCVTECSAQGRCDDAVKAWEEILTASPKTKMDLAACRATIKGFGVWDADEIAAMDDTSVRQKALWIACGSVQEEIRTNPSGEVPEIVWLMLGE